MNCTSDNGWQESPKERGLHKPGIRAVPRQVLWLYTMVLRARAEHKKLALHLGLGSLGVFAQDLMDRGLVACTATDAHEATLRVPRHME